MAKTKVLIIEDEEAIADLLSYGLQKEGFLTLTADTGTDGLKAVETFKPDLLLLDWMLPDLSGLEICKKITAARNISIVMITAKSDITDKVLGLEFGADDYITKPFDLREVIARIRTLIRRINQASGPQTEQNDDSIRFKDIEVNKYERVVKKNNKTIDLTPKEFDLLMTLYRYRGKVFTRTELLDFVWGYEYEGDTRTVDIHIGRLRKKLGEGDMIATVFGVGYKFEKQVD
ncbi:DNA-binding response regulator [Cohnella sp. CIP 111063]|uniref:response regulator transcription factor n=1 Tax=unclassified Cohnella TaxID=2636738 RepID=UPI000B8BB708|nr:MULTISPECIES: response regulator transcription factor [unclassified Cohnella]OXS54767.1 DNA-binding response regulator [Cohnella sp. CIP 111063]PRX64605.1 two-component system alkaline phosphatase synthesis response regulator PhoP [Cohnella sp. SGD-V74]